MFECFKSVFHLVIHGETIKKGLWNNHNKQGEGNRPHRQTHTEPQLQASRAEIITTTQRTWVCVGVIVWIRSTGGRPNNNDQFNGKVFLFLVGIWLCDQTVTNVEVSVTPLYSPTAITQWTQCMSYHLHYNQVFSFALRVCVSVCDILVSVSGRWKHTNTRFTTAAVFERPPPRPTTISHRWPVQIG